MPRAVLLACPICDAVLAISSKRVEVSKRVLRATAKSHLNEHELTESKAAIRKHAVAANAVEVIVSPAEYRRLPVNGWMDCDAAWVPDHYALGSDGSGSSIDRVTETTSPRSASWEEPSQ